MDLPPVETEVRVITAIKAEEGPFVQYSLGKMGIVGMKKPWKSGKDRFLTGHQL